MRLTREQYEAGAAILGCVIGRDLSEPAKRRAYRDIESYHTAETWHLSCIGFALRGIFGLITNATGGMVQ